MGMWRQGAVMMVVLERSVAGDEFAYISQKQTQVVRQSVSTDACACVCVCGRLLHVTPHTAYFYPIFGYRQFCNVVSGSVICHMPYR